jgi:hypothetical protein
MFFIGCDTNDIKGSTPGGNTTPEDNTTPGGKTPQGGDTTPGGDQTPEDNTGNEDNTTTVGATAAERWFTWTDETSTASIDFSVEEDSVCTVTVGGTTSTSWHTSAQYAYPASKDNYYTYIFEAWTETGSRFIWLQYFNNWQTNTYLGAGINLTTERRTFTIDSQEIPLDGDRALEFHCADQLGTFYVRILGIVNTTDSNNWTIDTTFERDPLLNGTWRYEGEEFDHVICYIFNDGLFDNSVESIGIFYPYYRGVYTTSNDTLYMLLTHIHGDSLYFESSSYDESNYRYNEETGEFEPYNTVYTRRITVPVIPVESRWYSINELKSLRVYDRTYESTTGLDEDYSLVNQVERFYISQEDIYRNPDFYSVSGHSYSVEGNTFTSQNFGTLIKQD